MSIKIYTDACSNLFPDIIINKKLDITVIPMSVEFDGKNYLCYQDILSADSFAKKFYEGMENGIVPHTSLANPKYFEEWAREDVENGDSVIFITTASGISSTYSCASAIAEEINEEFDRNCVFVIDSKTSGFGEGMIAMYAYELTKKYDDPIAIEKMVVEYVSTVRSEFIVDNLKYLRQSGRVSTIVSKIANLISIKPLLYGSNQAKIEMSSFTRGRQRSINKLAKQVIEHIKDKNSIIYVTHCNCIIDADIFVTLLKKEGCNNIELYQYDIISGSHVGPGCIAVFYEGTNRDF